MEPKTTAGRVWLRRDLRTGDNAALYRALKSCRQVHCVFVFDTAILGKLPRRDRRVEFIRELPVRGPRHRLARRWERTILNPSSTTRRPRAATLRRYAVVKTGSAP